MPKTHVFCWAALMATAAPSAAPDAATLFGARPSIEGISLSPDGAKIAYIAPRSGQGGALYVVDLASGDSKLVTAADGNPQRLSDCAWVSAKRLLCSIFGIIPALTGKPEDSISTSRLVAIDADGTNFKLVSEADRPHAAVTFGGDVIGYLPADDGTVLIGRYFGGGRGGKYGVERVDTNTLARTEIETSRYTASRYLSDQQGDIRIIGLLPSESRHMSGKTVSYVYKTRGGEWLPLGKRDIVTQDGIFPLAVDRDLDVVYTLRKVDGRQALYKIALDGSLREELVYAHPQVDVDGVVRIGRQGRVVGVRYVTDTSRTVYFDKEIEKLTTSLSKALPQLPSLKVASASRDESKLLLWAGSDADPGRYYIFDKKTRGLNEILLVRPELESTPLASVRPITYPAADGTMVPGYLTLPPGKADAKGLPALVMPHGGPEARDQWGFDWVAQYFANRGYAVLQPNFRGSTGYGDAWMQRNGFRSWKLAIGDVTDGGRWLVSSGVADPAKLAIFGWSYGGYAALQSAVVLPDLFKAVVAVAPVTDLRLILESSRGWSDFELQRERLGSGPTLGEGSPAVHAEAFHAPVLMFHGDVDRNVAITQSRLMAAKLKAAGKSEDLIVYPGLDHYLEDSAARADMLRRSDSFLRTAMHL